MKAVKTLRFYSCSCETAFTSLLNLMLLQLFKVDRLRLLKRIYYYSFKKSRNSNKLDAL